MDEDWKDKSELEQVIFSGMHGQPELRRQERLRYLGQYRERILEAVTLRQLRTDTGKHRLKKALADPRAHEFLVHSRARSDSMPLIQEARRNKVDFTIVSNPKFGGRVVAAVAASQAVDADRLFSDEDE